MRCYSRIGPPGSKREAERFGQALHSQSAHQVRMMDLHRARAYAQIISDRLIGQPIDQVTQHIAFAQVGQCGPLRRTATTLRYLKTSIPG